MIETRNLRKSYGAALVLDDVSLVLPRGGITTIIGANGAGKSTLLKAASNLLPAERGQITGGRILFGGQDVRLQSPTDHIRKGLVPVLEGRRLFRSLTIEENLITGAARRWRAGWSRSTPCFPG